jgi:2-polyprenyl-3-methyl-5-hydroxy-6-metoxy-1,4-benzoquinol methylase
MSKYSRAVIAEGSSQKLILDLVKKDSIVLEFGPSSGHMTKVMQEKGCKVYIVEYNKDDFKKAIEYAAGGICGDIFEFEWLKKWKNIKFDAIIFADVLEHLYNPAKIIQETKKVLKPGGELLVSLPNIAHDDIISNLLIDNFNYTPVGLLDNTHIRFWAYNNLKPFFKENGYFIIDEKFTRHYRHSTEQAATMDKNIINNNEFLFDSHKGGTIYQFILRLVSNEYAKEKHLKYRSKINLVTPSYNSSITFSSSKDHEFVANNLVVKLPYKSKIDFSQHAKIPSGCTDIIWIPYEKACIVSNIKITVNGVLTSFHTKDMIIDNNLIFTENNAQILIDLSDKAMANKKLKITAEIRPLDFVNLGEAYQKLAQKYLELSKHQLTVEHELEAIRNSKSYRIGRAATKPYRLTKKLFEK